MRAPFERRNLWPLAALALLAAGCGQGTPSAPGPVAVDVARPTAPHLARAFTPHDDFVRMGPAAEGDWLDEHDEPGQTYAEYLIEHAEDAGDSTRPVIYLQPIGAFPRDAPSLQQLARYTRIFFQRTVRVLPELHVIDLKVTSRVNGHTGKRQLLTGDLLGELRERLPVDAACVIGVTVEDLYPDPAWNYVFGYASLSERVGVFSFARHDPAFFGRPRSAETSRLVLRRSIATLAHEIGHMFGVRHCTAYECVMAGSNNQAEADRHPNHLCPEDLRKLHHVLGFDVVGRYDQLAAFYREHGLLDNAAWIRDRRAYVAGSQAHAKR